MSEPVLDNRPRSEILAKHGARLILVVALIAIISCCAFLPFTSVLNNINDDAYYYFGVSEHVAKGDGPTFDGIHKTSGYQPLWMLILVPVFWIFPNAPEAALRAGLVLQALLLFAAGAMILSVQRRIFSWQAVFASITCFVFIVFFRGQNGLESAALILALAALFVFGYYGRPFADDPKSPFREFVFGMLLGAVMLGRLDTVFLGAAVVAFRAWPVLVRSPRWRRSLVGSILIIAGASLVVAPFLLYNYITLGHAAPISGALKSIHSNPNFSPSVFLIRLGVGRGLFFFGIVVIAAVYFVWYVLSLRKTPPEPKRYYHTCMAALACDVVLHFLYMMLFVNWGMMVWQFFPCLLFLVMAVAAPVDWLLHAKWRRAVQYAYWCAMAALIVVGFAANWKRAVVQEKGFNWQTTAYDAALFVRDHTKPADVFALKDTGNFGYFSRRKVINLDGLVNDWDYQEVLKNRALNEYLKRNHVRYLVLHSTSASTLVRDGNYDSYHVTFRGRLHQVDSDPVLLYKKGEIYRRAYCEESEPNSYVIWDLWTQEKTR